MAVRVVDLLEVVDVEDEQAEGRADRRQDTVSRSSDSSNSRRFASPVSPFRTLPRAARLRRGARRCAGTTRCVSPIAANACTVSTGMLASSEPPHSPTATPMVSSSAVTGATIALQAPGSTASSRSSSSERRRGSACHASPCLPHERSGAVGRLQHGHRLAVVDHALHPVASAHEHRGARRTRAAARVVHERFHDLLEAVRPLGAGCRCTSVSSSAPLCRARAR